MGFDSQTIRLFLYLAPLLARCSARLQSENLVRSDIYIPVDSTYGCFRILNATHQIGCQSPQHGSVGVIHTLRSDDDLKYITDDPHGRAPFVIAVNASSALYKGPILQRLEESGNVAGVVVLYPKEDEVGALSSDYSCPNDKHSLYTGSPKYDHCKAIEWNKGADGLYFHDWDFPMFVVMKEEGVEQVIEECFARFNSDLTHPYPLCAAELVFPMRAAGDAQRCMRRNTQFVQIDVDTSEKQCDPIQSRNVFGLLPAATAVDTIEPQSIIVISAKADSLTGFSLLSNADYTVYPSVMTLFAIAELLGELDVDTLKGKRVLFVVFDGESMDYTGSTRMLYDMTHDAFPMPYNAEWRNESQAALIKPEHIGMWIEIGQVSQSHEKSKDAKYFVHTDPLTWNEQKFDKDYRRLIALGSNKLERTDKDKPLPPSSVQTFLRHTLNSSTEPFPAFVISDHKEEFQNKLYHSFADRSLIYPQQLTTLVENVDGLAQALAKFLQQTMTGTTTSVGTPKMTRQIADCIYKDPRCLLNFKIPQSSDITPTWSLQHIKDDVDRTAPTMFHTWTGTVTTLSLIKYMVPFTRALLHYSLGERRPMDKAEYVNCSAETFGMNSTVVYSFVWMPDLTDPEENSTKGYCLRSPVHFSLARSPAFDIEDYDFSTYQYPVWVESVWQDSSKLRLFLKSSSRWEYSVLSIGIIYLLVSLLLVYVFSLNADLLFPQSTESMVEGVENEAAAVDV